MVCAIEGIMNRIMCNLFSSLVVETGVGGASACACECLCHQNTSLYYEHSIISCNEESWNGRKWISRNGISDESSDEH